MPFDPLSSSRDLNTERRIDALRRRSGRDPLAARQFANEAANYQRQIDQQARADLRNADAADAAAASNERAATQETDKQAREAARLTKQTTALLKEQGVVFDPNPKAGIERPRLRKDGSAVFAPAFTSKPTTEGVRYRDERGQTLNVPLDAITYDEATKSNRFKDSGGQEHIVPGQPLTSVDKATGDRKAIVQTPDGAFAEQVVGKDERVARGLEFDKRKDALTQQSQLLAEQTQLADMEAAPLRDQVKEQRRALHSHYGLTEGSTATPRDKYREKQGSIFSVTYSGDQEIEVPVTDPIAADNAKKWIAERDRLNAAHDALASDLKAREAAIQANKIAVQRMAVQKLQLEQAKTTHLAELDAATRKGFVLPPPDYDKITGTRTDPIAKAQAKDALAKVDPSAAQEYNLAETAVGAATLDALNGAMAGAAPEHITDGQRQIVQSIQPFTDADNHVDIGKFGQAVIGALGAVGKLTGRGDQTTALQGRLSDAGQALIARAAADGVMKGIKGVGDVSTPEKRDEALKQTFPVDDPSRYSLRAQPPIAGQPPTVDITDTATGAAVAHYHPEGYVTMSWDAASPIGTQHVPQVRDDGLPVYFGNPSNRLADNQKTDLMQRGMSAVVAGGSDDEIAKRLKSNGLGQEDIRTMLNDGRLSFQEARAFNKAFYREDEAPALGVVATDEQRDKALDFYQHLHDSPLAQDHGFMSMLAQYGAAAKQPLAPRATPEPSSVLPLKSAIESGWNAFQTGKGITGAAKAAVTGGIVSPLESMARWLASAATGATGAVATAIAGKYDATEPLTAELAKNPEAARQFKDLASQYGLTPPEAAHYFASFEKEKHARAEAVKALLGSQGFWNNLTGGQGAGQDPRFALEFRQKAAATTKEGTVAVVTYDDGTTARRHFYDESGAALPTKDADAKIAALRSSGVDGGRRIVSIIAETPDQRIKALEAPLAPQIAEIDKKLDAALTPFGFRESTKARLKTQARFEALAQLPVGVKEMIQQHGGGLAYTAEKLPFIGGLVEAARLRPLAKTAELLQSGGTPTQAQLAELDEALNAMGRNRSFWAGVMDTTAMMPGFIVELATTRGVAKAGEAVSMAALKKALMGGVEAQVAARALSRGFAADVARKIGSEAATSALNRSLAARTVSGLAGEALRAPVASGHHMLASALETYATKGVQVGRDDESGKLVASLDKTHPDWWQSLGRGYTQWLMENASERFGDFWEASAIGRALNEAAGKTAFVRALRKLNPSKAESAFGKFLRQAGWHGTVMEMAEERANDIGQGLAFGEWNLPDANQLMQELVSFSLPAVASAAWSHHSARVEERKQRAQQAADAAQAKQSAVAKAAALNQHYGQLDGWTPIPPEHADTFEKAMESPEVAAALTDYAAARKELEALPDEQAGPPTPQAGKEAPGYFQHNGLWFEDNPVNREWQKSGRWTGAGVMPSPVLREQAQASEQQAPAMLQHPPHYALRQRMDDANAVVASVAADAHDAIHDILAEPDAAKRAHYSAALKISLGLPLTPEETEAVNANGEDFDASGSLTPQARARIHDELPSVGRFIATAESNRLREQSLAPSPTGAATGEGAPTGQGFHGVVSPVGNAGGGTSSRYAELPDNDGATLTLEARENLVRRVATDVAARYRGLGDRLQLTEGRVDTDTGAGYDFDRDIVAVSLPALAQSIHWGELSSRATAEHVEATFSEELRHRAHHRSAETAYTKTTGLQSRGADGRPTAEFNAWRAQYYGDIWRKEFTDAGRKAVVDAYTEWRFGSNGEVLNDKGKEVEPWRAAFEGIRMISQARAEGRVTELEKLFAAWPQGVIEHLKAALAYLRDLAKQTLSAAIEADIAHIEKLLALWKQTPREQDLAGRILGDGASIPAGKPITLSTPDHKQTVQAKATGVSLDQLVGSSDSRYPGKELQFRNRKASESPDEAAESRAQQAEMARNLQINPEQWRFYHEGNTTDKGRLVVAPLYENSQPVTTPDGRPMFYVVSGNGRRNALSSLYRNGTPAAYETGIRQALAADGVTDAATMPQPVAVAIMQPASVEEVVAVAKASNPDKTPLQAVNELADTLQRDEKLMGLWDTSSSDEGDPRAASNANFWRGLRQRGLFKGGFVDGKPTDATVEEVENAMLSALMGGTQNRDTLRKVLLQGRGLGLSRVIAGFASRSAALLKLARTKPAYDIAPLAQEALTALVRFKEAQRRGDVASLDDYLGQGDMFAQETSAAGNAFTRALAGASSAKSVRELLDSYLSAADAVDTSTPDMFGVAPATRDELLQSALDTRPIAADLAAFADAAGSDSHSVQVLNAVAPLLDNLDAPGRSAFRAALAYEQERLSEGIPTALEYQRGFEGSDILNPDAAAVQRWIGSVEPEEAARKLQAALTAGRGRNLPAVLRAEMQAMADGGRTAGRSVLASSALHGSSDLIRRFDESKIGSGRGLQQGWGAYVTTERLQSEGYARKDWTENGWVHHVNIAPDDRFFMLWDAPLSEQTREVRSRLGDLARDPAETGQQIYHRLTREVKAGRLSFGSESDSPEKRVSKFLLDRGIAGNRYSGTEYVLFDASTAEIISAEELLTWQEHRAGDTPRRYTFISDSALAKPKESPTRYETAEYPYLGDPTARWQDAEEPEASIVNPIDPNLSADEKVDALDRLSDENIPLVQKVLDDLGKLGLKGKWSKKFPDRIQAKASRPSIRTEKPWHDVEHVRDGLRFKVALNRFEQVPDILRTIQANGIQVIKLDTAKMFRPKAFGWRFVAFDLRMPNGQLVEFYAPVPELDAKEIKHPNHALFEKWRNVSKAELNADPLTKREMERDIATSRSRYDAAFAAAMARMGYKDLSASEASWNNIVALLESLIGENVSTNSAALHADGGDFRQIPAVDRITPSPVGNSTNTLPSSPSKTLSDSSSFTSKPTTDNRGEQALRSAGLLQRARRFFGGGNAFLASSRLAQRAEAAHPSLFTEAALGGGSPIFGKREKRQAEFLEKLKYLQAQATNPSLTAEQRRNMRGAATKLAKDLTKGQGQLFAFDEVAGSKDPDVDALLKKLDGWQAQVAEKKKARARQAKQQTEAASDFFAPTPGADVTQTTSTNENQERHQERKRRQKGLLSPAPVAGTDKQSVPAAAPAIEKTSPRDTLPNAELGSTSQPAGVDAAVGSADALPKPSRLGSGSGGALQTGDGVPSGGPGQRPVDSGMAALEKPASVVEPSGEVQPVTGSTSKGGWGTPQRRGRGDAASRGVGSVGARPTRPPIGSPERNHVITEDATLAEGGAVTRARNNIAAIRLVRQLDAENRNATPEEKATLAKFVGWGALSQAFDDAKAAAFARGEHTTRRETAGVYERYGPAYAAMVVDYRKQADALESWHKKWGEFNAELKSLLSPEEYAAAAESTINAHYTSPDVIRSMWQMVERLGFKGGHILEPAGGIGHFFGLMPADVADRSRLSGVELDALSGRIFARLYPEADVQVTGFESADIPNSSVDLAISNVPFADVSPYDAGMEAQGAPRFSLHNYFFAKALQKVKPGGLVAFITTAHTLDSNMKQREWIAQHGDLVGAIRLPNTAFRGNAGTDVVTDIVFLRRKDGAPFDSAQPWTALADTKTADGNPLRINEYFVEHPAMILGRLANDGSMYGGKKEMTVHPTVGRNLIAELNEAVARLPVNVAGEGKSEADDVRAQTYIAQQTRGQKMGAITRLEDGSLAIAGSTSQDEAILKPSNRRLAERFMALRDALNTLYRVEADGASTDAQVDAARAELNAAYDRFTADYGNVHKHAALLNVDPDFYRTLGLEIEEKPKGTLANLAAALARKKTYRKADVFARRVLSPKTEPTRADNVKDAMGVSLGWRGRLDVPFMASLTGQTMDAVEREMLNDGLVYRNPETGLLETPETYLSGNVRKKLRTAQQAAKGDPSMQRNVDELQRVQPPDVEWKDVGYHAGSSWIPVSIYQQFAAEIFGTRGIEVMRHPAVGEFINERTEVRFSGAETPAMSQTFSTGRIKAVDLLETVLNNQSPIINDYDDKGKPHFSPKATEEAKQIAERIKDAFKSWVDSNADVQAELVRLYNETFNSHVVPQFDGQHLQLPWVANGFELFPDKKNTVWRAIQQGNMLVAHGVGGGKTIVGTAIALEQKRLGLAKKPLIVVHNATLEQFATTISQMAPTARVLVARKTDLEGPKRKEFMARVASGDWDAVVMAHSTFDLLPDDPAYERKLIEELIDQLDDAIRAEGGDPGVDPVKVRDDPTVKELAKAKKRLRAKLDKLLDRRADDVLTFQELGIDSLILDEAHLYKKLPFVTRMTRIAGIDTGTSERGAALMVRTRFIHEKNDGRGVFTMTGTPVTNTLGETWNMVRLVRPDLLEQFNISNFDAFVSNFAGVQRSAELRANGQYKMVDRLATLENLPEWNKFFRLAADVKMGEDMVVKGRPGIKGGKPELLAVERTPAVSRVVTEIQRVLEWYDQLDGKTKKQNSHIPLVTYNAAKLAAIDARMVLPNAPDEPGSKVNVMVGRVKTLYDRTSSYKGTQVIFADSFRPLRSTKLDLSAADMEEQDAAADNESSGFSLYDEIKRKLIEQGVPAKEIASIQDVKNDAQRERLFDRVNSGEVRIIIGSTQKLGTGVNIQQRMIAAHHLDVPWTPAELEQRDGRVYRQGNIHGEMGVDVEIYRYGMRDTLDAALWQKLETKERFIKQALSGKLNERSIEDDTGLLGYAQQKAVLTGALGLRKFELEQKIREIETERAAWTQRTYNARQTIARLERDIVSSEKRLPYLEERWNQVSEAWDGLEGGPLSITLNGRTYTSEKDAKEALQALFDVRQKHLGGIANPETAPSAREPIASLIVNGVPVLVGVSGVTEDIANATNPDKRWKVNAEVFLDSAIPLGSAQSAGWVMRRVFDGRSLVENALGTTKAGIDRAMAQIEAAQAEASATFTRDDEAMRLASELAGVMDQLSGNGVSAEDTSSQAARELDAAEASATPPLASSRVSGWRTSARAYQNLRAMRESRGYLSPILEQRMLEIEKRLGQSFLFNLDDPSVSRWAAAAQRHREAPLLPAENAVQGSLPLASSKLNFSAVSRKDDALSEPLTPRALARDVAGAASFWWNSAAAGVQGALDAVTPTPVASAPPKTYNDPYEEGDPAAAEPRGGSATSPRNSSSGPIRALAGLYESAVRNQEPKAEIEYHSNDDAPDFASRYDTAGQLHVAIHSEVYDYLHALDPRAQEAALSLLQSSLAFQSARGFGVARDFAGESIFQDLREGFQKFAVVRHATRAALEIRMGRPLSDAETSRAMGEVSRTVMQAQPDGSPSSEAAVAFAEFVLRLAIERRVTGSLAEADAGIFDGQQTWQLRAFAALDNFMDWALAGGMWSEGGRVTKATSASSPAQAATKGEAPPKKATKRTPSPVWKSYLKKKKKEAQAKRAATMAAKTPEERQASQAKRAATVAKHKTGRAFILSRVLRDAHRAAGRISDVYERWMDRYRQAVTEEERKEAREKILSLRRLAARRILSTIEVEPEWNQAVDDLWATRREELLPRLTGAPEAVKLASNPVLDSGYFDESEAAKVSAAMTARERAVKDWMREKFGAEMTEKLAEQTPLEKPFTQVSVGPQDEIGGALRSFFTSKEKLVRQREGTALRAINDMLRRRIGAELLRERQHDKSPTLLSSSRVSPPQAATSSPQLSIAAPEDAAYLDAARGDSGTDPLTPDTDQEAWAKRNPKSAAVMRERVDEAALAPAVASHNATVVVLGSDDAARLNELERETVTHFPIAVFGDSAVEWAKNLPDNGTLSQRFTKRWNTHPHEHRSLHDDGVIPGTETWNLLQQLEPLKRERDALRAKDSSAKSASKANFDRKWDRDNPRHVYVRFGAPPRSGRSTNSRDNITEPGISVYDAYDHGKVLELRPSVTAMLGVTSGFSRRVAYVATAGKVVGEGSDGEPTIQGRFSKSKKPVVIVAPLQAVLKSADLATFDNGRLVPPSERFNPESLSILQSSPVSAPSLHEQALRAALEKAPPLFRAVFAAVLKGSPLSDIARAHNLTETAVQNIANRVQGNYLTSLRVLQAKELSPDVGVSYQRGPKRAFAQLKPRIAGGRPDLALGAVPAVAAVDQIRNATGQPGQVTLETLEDTARAMLAAEPDAARALVRVWAENRAELPAGYPVPESIKSVLDEARSTQALHGLMTMAAKLMVSEAAMNTTALRDPKTRLETAQMIMAYRELGTEQARALAARRDPYLSPAERHAAFLAEGLLAPDPQTRASYVKAGTAEEREAIMKAWLGQVDKLKASLRAQGIDVDAILAEWNQEQQARKPLAGAAGETFAKADKATKIIVTVLQQGGTPQQAAAAAGLPYEQARAKYEAFLRAVNNAGVQAAEKAKAAMLASSPFTYDYAVAAGLHPLSVWDAPAKRPKATRTSASARHSHGATPGRPHPARNAPNERQPGLGMEAAYQGPRPTARPVSGDPGAQTGLPFPKPAEKGAIPGGLIEAYENGKTSPLHDPIAMRRIADQISATKSTKLDKLMEWWKASILSGPQTHVVNSTSNAAFQLYDQWIKRLPEAAINDVLHFFGQGSKDAPSLADFPHMMSAVVPAIQRAAKDALRAFISNDFAATELMRGAEKQLTLANAKLDRFAPAIGGRLGDIVRIPFRLLGMADEFFKAFAGNLEVAAQSHRMARSEGLHGAAYQSRIAELMKPGSLAWQRAADYAEKVTFTRELGQSKKAVDMVFDRMAQRITDAKGQTRGMKLLDFIIPFVKTPTNIFKTGVEYSPIGGLFALVDMAREYSQSKAGIITKGEIYNRARLVHDLAQQMIAWGVVLAIRGMLPPDDDDGLPSITGSAPWNKKGESDLRYRTAPPYSIRIGDKWFSYARIEPFATALAGIVDAMNANDVNKATSAVIGQLRDKTFLAGLSDLANILEDPDRYGNQWAANILTGFVPNLIRQPLRNTDAVVRDTKPQGDMGFLDELGARIGYTLWTRGAPAKMDAWGRPVMKNNGDQFGLPLTDLPFRILTPAQRSDASQVLDVDRYLLNWNLAHADNAWAPRPMDRRLERTINGKPVTIYLTEAEYQEMQGGAGRAALAALASQKWDWTQPTQEGIERIKDTYEASTRIYREAFKQRRAADFLKLANP